MTTNRGVSWSESWEGDKDDVPVVDDVDGEDISAMYMSNLHITQKQRICTGRRYFGIIALVFFQFLVVFLFIFTMGGVLWPLGCLWSGSLS